MGWVIRLCCLWEFKRSWVLVQIGTGFREPYMMLLSLHWPIFGDPKTASYSRLFLTESRSQRRTFRLFCNLWPTQAFLLSRKNEAKNQVESVGPEHGICKLSAHMAQVLESFGFLRGSHNHNKDST